MEAFIQVLIVIHVILGSIGVISGPVSAIAKKGGKLHRLSGKVFAWSMIISAILALFISSMPGHKSLFLFCIGIFGLYLVASGYRVLKIKKLGRGQRPALLDWTLSVSMGVFGAVMFIYGGWILLRGGTFGVVLLLFGFFGLMLFKGDLKMYLKRPEDPRFWLFQHINKMNGGLITAFTALLVNNNQFMPQILGWLLPTLIGSLLGTYWNKKYKGKQKPDRRNNLKSAPASN